MKTKEEILKEATRRTLNINEGSPLHDAVMKAMEEYAQEQVKLFCQPAVVGRSEQLKCGNSNPPCSPNIKFGYLECTECNWSE